MPRDRSASPDGGGEVVHRAREYIPPNQDDANWQALKALEGCSFSTWNEPWEAIQRLAKLLGFGIVRKRSKKRESDGVIYQIDLECTYGSTKSGQGASTSTKETARRRRDCPWKANLYLNQGANNRWVFTPKDYGHNHRGTVKDKALPVHRRDALTALSPEIMAMTSNPRFRFSDIVDFVTQRNPSLNVQAADIRYHIKKQREEKAEGRSPFEQFLEALRATPGTVLHLRREGDQPNGAVVQIFWTFPQCLEKWEIYHDLLSFDNTYKTNKYRWPLMNITGVTNVLTTYSVAFALSTGETTADFRWILQCLKSTAATKQITDPYVVLSDFDRAFKNAASEVFPDTVKQQICIWHVMKNILWHLVQKWEGSLNGTEVGHRAGTRGSNINNNNGDGDNEGPGNDDITAAGLLDDYDRRYYLGSGIRNPNAVAFRAPPPPTNPQRKYVNNADGMLAAIKAFIYAPTEEEYEQAFT